MKTADAVFAFGYLDKKQKDRVKGGTGFSVQLAWHLDLPTFIFELKLLKWFRVTSDSFEEWSRLTVHGKCAVIGLRQFHLNSPAYSELLALSV